MRTTRLLGTAGVLLLLLATAGEAGRGQHIPANQLPPLAEAPGARPDDAAARALEERQAKLRNDDRQKRLVADTDKLLALATQLHEDVGKTDKNVLSLDVIKRADEIERLAHAVKDRMRN